MAKIPHDVILMLKDFVKNFDNRLKKLRLSCVNKSIFILRFTNKTFKSFFNFIIFIYWITFTTKTLITRHISFES